MLKPEAVNARLSPLRAAVETATAARDELAAQVEKDRAKVAELDAAAVDDPTDKRIAALAVARTALDVRARALNVREGNLAEALGALAGEEMRIDLEHVQERAPLAFASTFKAAAAPHLAELEAALATIGRETKALEELHKQAQLDRRDAAPVLERHGNEPAGSGGNSFPVGDLLVQTVVNPLRVAFGHVPPIPKFSND